MVCAAIAPHPVVLGAGKEHTTHVCVCNKYKCRMRVASVICKVCVICKQYFAQILHRTIKEFTIDAHMYD